MLRMLQFSSSIFHRLSQGGTSNDTSGPGSLNAAAREAYGKFLDPYHGWLLKNAFRVGLNGLPRWGQSRGHGHVTPSVSGVT